MMVIDPVYEIGEIVYLKTDFEQRAKIVFGFNIRPNNIIYYCLSVGSVVSEHYDFEINREQDLTMKMDA